MIDRKFLTDLAGLLAGAEQDSRALLVAADWCGDRGEPEVGEGCRWLERSGKRPVKRGLAGAFHWRWDFSESPLSDDSNLLPPAFRVIAATVCEFRDDYHEILVPSLSAALLFVVIGWKSVGHLVLLAEHLEQHSERVA